MRSARFYKIPKRKQSNVRASNTSAASMLVSIHRQHVHNISVSSQLLFRKCCNFQLQEKGETTVSTISPYITVNTVNTVNTLDLVQPTTSSDGMLIKYATTCCSTLT